MVVSVTSVLSFLPLLFLMLIFSLLGELFHYRFKGWDFRLKYLYSLQSWDLCCSLLRFFLPDCLCPFILGGGSLFPPMFHLWYYTWPSFCFILPSVDLSPLIVFYVWCVQYGHFIYDNIIFFTAMMKTISALYMYPWLCPIYESIGWHIYLIMLLNKQRSLLEWIGRHYNNSNCSPHIHMLCLPPQLFPVLLSSITSTSPEIMSVLYLLIHRLLSWSIPFFGCLLFLGSNLIPSLP